VSTVSEVRTGSTLSSLEEILGDDAALLTHECRTVPKEQLHLPGPDFVERYLTPTDRPIREKSLERSYSLFE
jgi:class I fructose-bisphosphate aldolase